MGELREREGVKPWSERLRELCQRSAGGAQGDAECLFEAWYKISAGSQPGSVVFLFPPEMYSR